MNLSNELSLKDILFRIQIGFATSLDPATAFDTTCREITDNVYERLVYYSNNEIGKFEPILVSSWSLSRDELTYKFDIRQNVLFHDGEILDSFAVANSLMRMLRVSEKARLVFKDIMDEQSFKIVDKYTLEIRLKHCCPDFLDFIAMQEASIVSPKVVDLNNNTEKNISEWLRKNTCGTGPFKVGNYNEQSLEITLIRNEEYWGGKAKLNEVRIKTIYDYEERKKLISDGTADIISVQASKLHELQNSKEINIENFLALDMVFFVINIKNEFLRNIFLRMAISYSFNYDVFLRDVRKGFGIRISTPVPKGIFAHNTQIPEINFDIKFAMENLKKSGIDSTTIPSFKILCVKGMEDAEISCEMLAEGLKKLGINSVIEKEYFERFVKRFDTGDFDLSFLSWAPDMRIPDNNIFEFYHSKGKIGNIIGYSNEIVDKNIEMARTECDKLKREKMYFDLQEKLVNEFLYIWLYQGYNVKIHRQNVHGLKYNQMDGDYYFYPLYKS